MPLTLGVQLYLSWAAVIELKKKKKKTPATRPNNFLIGSSKRPKWPNGHEILTI